MLDSQVSFRQNLLLKEPGIASSFGNAPGRPFSYDFQGHKQHHYPTGTYPKKTSDTILIYDADADLVEMICIALEMVGFKTHGLNDGDADFLEIIREVKAGLVMLDFIYTGAFCIKWCRSIKYRYPRLPVIALSTNHQIGELYRKHGFDDCIPKPFDLEQLYETVGKYVPANKEGI